MTTEVAILNKQAVALAADSAVTLGYDPPKIFNTLKIFSLSKYHPVGIMVYSSAQVMDAPVETVIKVFRKKLDVKEYSTLDDYYREFQKFLKEEVDLFPHEARRIQCESIIADHFENLKVSIGLEIGAQYPRWAGPTQTQVRTVARKIINEHCQQYGQSNDLPGVTPKIRNQLRRELRPAIEFWQHDLRSFFPITKDDLKVLGELCLDLILKDKASQCETGFVIAGFGEMDYFPRLRSFEFESSILDIHKLKDIENVNMRNHSPQIVAFAQKEMVETFLQGRSSSLDEELLKFIDTFFMKEKHLVANHPDPTTRARAAQIHSFLDTMNDRLKREFVTRLQQFTSDYHVRPIEMTIAAMPKEDLAKMAQALVNLTAIKRRSTPDAETVGGPTDVAVITKGDGMIWIDRKHYFDPTLNPTFMSNYFRRNEEQTKNTKGVKP